MNEKVNEVIYNRASAYKQKTLAALKMSASPERRRQAADYGLPGKADARLDNLLESEKMTTQKALGQLENMMRMQSSPPPKQRSPNGKLNFEVYRNLERIETRASPQHQAISPFKPDNTI